MLNMSQNFPKYFEVVTIISIFAFRFEKSGGIENN